VGEEDKRLFTNSKLGGSPDWLGAPGEIPVCKLCNSAMHLLLQSYDPLEVLPSMDRVIYLFGCNSSKCSARDGSWKAVRGQMIAQTENKQESIPIPIPTPTLESEPEPAKPIVLFASTSSWDDAQDSSFSEAATQDIDLESLMKMRELQLVEKPLPSVESDTEPVIPVPFAAGGVSFSKEQPRGQFRSFYLDIQPELMMKRKKHINEEEQFRQLQRYRTEYEEPEEGSGYSGRPGLFDGDSYEVAKDKTFLSFQKHLMRNPDQCVRYCFGGEPLWYNDKRRFKTGAPACTRCGAPRVFELQLMPTVIWLFKLGPGELEFGTVVLYSCSRSCGGVGYFEELLIVQSAE